MIKSMTAYARTEIQSPPYTVRVEVRSYNSRHLDVALRLTHGYEALEDRVKGVIAGAVARGRVDMRIQIQDLSEADSAFSVDLPRARAYREALAALQQSLGLTGAVGIDTVLSAGNMIQAVELEKNAEEVWPPLESGLQAALADLDAMRRVEGDHMARDLGLRLDLIEGMLGRVGEQAAQLPELVHQRLCDRIAVLTQGVVEIDGARIAQEAALLADRSDISEEIVRTASHIRQFRNLMKDDTAAGRPLNFLLQEFNREFNTMGSKSGQASLSHIIVAAKSELEKIREQVQNVE